MGHTAGVGGIERLTSRFSRWLRGLTPAVAPPEPAQGHEGPRLPTEAEARKHDFAWDPASVSARISVGPWVARISPAGDWINVAILRPPDLVLDGAMPAFDPWAAVHLRSALASGLDPSFVADGAPVMVLGILSDDDARTSVVRTVAVVRGLLRDALSRVVRHPDPSVVALLERHLEREFPPAPSAPNAPTKPSPGPAPARSGAAIRRMEARGRAGRR